MTTANKQSTTLTALRKNSRAPFAGAAAMCALGSIITILAVPMSGCASSSPRADSTLNEINPAIAHAQRQRQEAIKHYQVASQLHLDGELDQALGEYRAAIELDGKLYAAWNNMGQLLMAQGNYADAVSAFRVSSGLEPTDPRPKYNIGFAYQKIGWAKDSYEHFAEALACDPNYLPALRGLIRSAEMLGLGDQTVMNHIRNAQLHETNDQWRDYLRTQQYRVQAILKD